MTLKYKGLLMDLDNTLYDYNHANGKAMEAMLSRAETLFSVSADHMLETYLKARHDINVRLKGTAASHNRLLYIQKTLEHLGVHSYSKSLELYHEYWETFLDHMIFYDFVIEFLNDLRLPVCIVSDLTSQIQYRKIVKMGLETHITYLVTSEESGMEKPGEASFLLAMQKLNTTHDQVCMIGDDYEKDMVGAELLGIDGFWFNPEGKKVNVNSDRITVFNHFSELAGNIYERT